MGEIGVGRKPGLDEPRKPGGDWAVSRNGEWFSGSYVSPEDAMTAGHSDLGLESTERFWIGRCVPKKLSDYLLKWDLECLVERAEDDVHPEAVEGWLVGDLTIAQFEMLEEALDDWAKKAGLEPSFFGIADIRECSPLLRAEADNGDCRTPEDVQEGAGSSPALGELAE